MPILYPSSIDPFKVNWTLAVARTAAKGNPELLKILDGLKFRTGKPKKTEAPA